MKASSASDKVRYAIRDVVQAAEAEAERRKAEGLPKIIYCNIGDPCAYGLSPPNSITDAAAEAMRNKDKFKGYAHSTGDPELRTEIAGLEGCAPEQVFVTAGLSEGVKFAMRVLLDPGQSILLPNPTYPLYPTEVIGVLGESRYYEPDENWAPNTDDLRSKIDDTTRAIVVINPNNPTGAVYPLNVLKEIGDIAAEHNLAIFADEVYDHIFLDKEVQMHKLKDVVPSEVPVFSGNGLSKNFLYPGARVGYVAIHNDSEGGLTDAFLRQCNARLSINWEMQRGALAGYKAGFDFLPPELAKIRRRRDIICKRVEEIPGLSVKVPPAALYAFVKVDGYKSTGEYHKLADWNFTYDLLREAGVLVVPGSAFYKNHSDELYFRTTLLPDEATLEDAMNRIEIFMKARLG